ncbi:MAG: class I SAM-dependent rRNA methyltransferase [Anaerolineae bacterium]|nr:class I SAM-dependent rRNA methyltransferase [Anaerolineae bacterium]
MTTFPIITLSAEREKPIRNRHPWVFSGGIKKLDGTPEPGSIVEVRGADGRFLARGYYNAQSQIQARLLSWDEDEQINEAWWRLRLAKAVSARTHFLDRGAPSGVRLINAENDFLPGLIVDKYGDTLVLQALTLGIDQRKHMIAEALAGLVKVKGVYERSDVDVRRLEGLEQTTGVLWGEEPPKHIAITEHGVTLLVDVRTGHKTGTYLDQADNRALVGAWVARTQAKRVLNVFSYTGGFGVHAGKNGAQTVNIDSSAEALDLAEETYRANGLRASGMVEGDAFAFLRAEIEDKSTYDLIVLDPPKFAQNKQHVERAARGYKDINLHALRLVNSGGYLFTYSCSGAVDADLFQKIVFGAIADSGRTGQIVRWLSAGEDHPVALTFPEGAYLKGLVVRVE